MPRPKLHADDAAKQRAYRQRVRERVERIEAENAKLRRALCRARKPKKTERQP